MSVATSVAIGMGVSAAASIASAKIASNASKHAADTQAAGAAAGLAASKEALSPYQQMGQQSLGRLGINGGQGPGSVLFQPHGQPFQPGQGQAAYGIPQQGQQGPPPTFYGQPVQGVGAGPVPDQGGQMQSLGQLGNAMQPDQSAPLGGTPMPQAGAPPAAGDMWTIQSPDGETKQFPAAIAQQYVAKGARRIS